MKKRIRQYIIDVKEKRREEAEKSADPKKQ